jgi:hypothetical protein
LQFRRRQPGELQEDRFLENIVRFVSISLLDINAIDDNSKKRNVNAGRILLTFLRLLPRNAASIVDSRTLLKLQFNMQENFMPEIANQA